MKAAVSFGEAMRPMGISRQMDSISSSVRQAFIFVSIMPQETAFTAIPLGASSLASAFVNAFNPPLEAE